MKSSHARAGFAALLLCSALALPAGAQTLRIGLQEDPDTLDPTLARTFVSRIVFASLCDKLVDYDANLAFKPQLATSWEVAPDGLSVVFKLRDGVLFHDGEKMDAEAVKFSIERHQNFPESRRRSEINVVKTVEVIDPLTVKMTLTSPFSPLISQFADRPGMIVSPKAAREAGANFTLKPVCAGPFRFVERVVQDRIVLEKFPQYWDAANIHLQRVVFQPIPDTTVRLANLQAGSLDMLERLNPTDIPAVKRDRRLTFAEVTSLGYQGITYNTNNGPRGNTPMGQDWRVRKALELSIDRNVINQVVFEGAHTVGNQAVTPTSPYYDKSQPVPGRDVAAAKKLLQEAGVKIPYQFELIIANNNVEAQQGQVIQAMAAEAGFDVKLLAMEFAAGLNAQTKGEFDAIRVGWSGRVDPDGNIHVFWHSQGSQNDSKYKNAEVDRLVDAARLTSDTAERAKLYAEAAKIYIKEGAHTYLYHLNNHFALSTKVTGFVPNPDGLIRLQGVKVQ